MINPYQKSKIKFQKENYKKTSIDDKGNIIRIYEFLTDNTVRSGGRAKTALCPFHGDRNPSFALYEDTATYYCFTCEETGDSLDLIMKLRECDFKEALEIANSV